MEVQVSEENESQVTQIMGQIFSQDPVVYYNDGVSFGAASVYCDEPKSALLIKKQRMIACLSKGIDVRGGWRIRIRKIANRDWAESWKRHFKPIEIGSRLLVKPSWSRRRQERSQAVVTIDPGLSFGTGHHPTTRYCLEELVQFAEQGKPASFLDVGCGSGILAIAAARLGFYPVSAFDLDPTAVRTCRENLELNQVEDRVRLSLSDLSSMAPTAQRHYDLICANLTVDLLVQESDRIVTRLAKDGVLVLAGILDSEFDRVVRVYSGHGLNARRSCAEDIWISGSFSRS